MRRAAPRAPAPVDQRIRRTLYHARVGGEPVNHLHRGSIILAQGHLDQFGLISIGTFHDRSHLQALGAKDERGDGDDHGDNCVMHVHVDLRVSPGHELAVAVVDIDFHQQGSGAGIDGPRSAHQFAGEGLSGKFGKCKRGGCSRNRRLGINLGNVDVDTQYADGRDAKHLGAGAGVDQLSHIDIAGRDHAGLKGA